MEEQLILISLKEINPSPQVQHSDDQTNLSHPQKHGIYGEELYEKYSI